ncbi:MAG: c-type cytochrome [Chitinophagales bacterium]|nr:c-type cytochrome [Chitinophagales bacterium]
MKRILKVIGILIMVVLLGAAVGLSYVSFALPDVGPAPELKVASNPAMVARGQYLANHVAVCIDCHSTRDWSLYSGPPKTGTFGQGGEIFDQNMGFPGKYFAPNITPEGIGHWTDGEIYRAITCGVAKDGRALFSIMPHIAYGKMSMEDATAIVAYIRALQPIKQEVPVSESDFPMNFIINTIPQKANHQPIPAKSDTLKYGEYMITMAACKDCHTRMEKGSYIEGMEYAGNMEFKMPNGVLRSANITPDKATGIGNWSKQAFISRFKMYQDAANIAKVDGKSMNSIMPWTMYAGMTEEDLGAIYSYLQSLKPIQQEVVKFSPH